MEAIVISFPTFSFTSHHRSPLTYRGIVTEWTVVDMSTQLLRRSLPEIDAYPVSLHYNDKGIGPA